MRFLLFICCVFTFQVGMSQTNQLHLKNALVVGQLDKSEDRFTMEINFTEMLASSGIKAMASLNVLKEGSPVQLLASDSIQQILKNKGINTYLLVSVRGYDRKFKPAKNHESLAVEIANGHLFPLYRDEISSITFEFSFYRDGQFVGYDLVKMGGIGSRDAVLKKFRKKINKRIQKHWK
jgi:hypothetical protein